MAVIHYAWELGAGFGHSGRARVIAGALAALGHEVRVSVRDPVTSAQAFAGTAMPLRPAPVWRHRTLGVPTPEANHAEVLLRVGYLEPGPLSGLLAGWLSLLGSPRPDVVVADYAPTAVLACRILGIPCATIGNGFAVPPSGSPMPPLRDWEAIPSARLAAAEARLLATSNAVLAAHGAPPLAQASDLLRADCPLVCSWPELDAMGRSEADEHWWGPNLGRVGVSGAEAAPVWPAQGGPRVVAYLKTEHPDHALVLQALAARGCAVCCFIPEVAGGRPPPVVHPTIRYANAPIDLPRALRGAALCVCHAGDGTIGAALLAGVPVLLLPMQGEQFLVARQVERHGLGLNAAQRPRPTAFGSLIDTLLSDGAAARIAARAFAARHAGFDGAEQACAIARRVIDLARDGSPSR